MFSAGVGITVGFAVGDGVAVIVGSTIGDGVAVIVGAHVGRHHHCCDVLRGWL